MTYKEAVESLSKKLNLPFKVVDKVYKSYWLAIRDKLSSLPLKEDLTEEEFNQLQTNVNIPSIGKLTCTYERYSKIKERYRYMQTLRNKND